jgi:hypothetical protein
MPHLKCETFDKNKKCHILNLKHSKKQDVPFPKCETFKKTYTQSWALENIKPSNVVKHCKNTWL